MIFEEIGNCFCRVDNIECLFLQRVPVNSALNSIRWTQYNVVARMKSGTELVVESDDVSYDADIESSEAERLEKEAYDKAREKVVALGAKIYNLLQEAK